MSKDVTPGAVGGQLICPADGGMGGIPVLLAGETFWLDQAQITELYQTTSQNLKSICAEGELDESVTCQDYFQVRQERPRLEAEQAAGAMHSKGQRSSTDAANSGNEATRESAAKRNRQGNGG